MASKYYPIKILFAATVLCSSSSEPSIASDNISARDYYFSSTALFAQGNREDGIRHRIKAVELDPTYVTLALNLNYKMDTKKRRAIVRMSDKASLEAIKKYHPNNKYALTIVIAKDCEWHLSDNNIPKALKRTNELIELLNPSREFNDQLTDRYDYAMSHRISKLIPLLASKESPILRKKAIELIYLTEKKSRRGINLFFSIFSPLSSLNKESKIAKAIYECKCKRFESGRHNDSRWLYYLVELAEYYKKYDDALKFEKKLLDKVSKQKYSYPLATAYKDYIRLKVLAGKVDEAKADFHNKIWEPYSSSIQQHLYDSCSHCGYQRFPSTSLAELSMVFLVSNEVSTADEVFRESLNARLYNICWPSRSKSLYQATNKFKIGFARIGGMNKQSEAYQFLFDYYKKSRKYKKAQELTQFVIDKLNSEKKTYPMLVYKVSDLQLLYGTVDQSKQEYWNQKSQQTFERYLEIVPKNLRPIGVGFRKARLKKLGLM